MPRWLGIDHGAKRIGVAAGSTGDCIASPLKVISAVPPRLAIEQIIRLAMEYDVAGIVVGWPLNMDDTQGPQAALARELGVQLAKLGGLDVRMWDERLSSFTADQSIAGLYTRDQRKARQDAVAAAVILQDFLQADGPARAPRAVDVQLDASKPEKKDGERGRGGEGEKKTRRQGDRETGR
jgi:putative Holliday junction resolvase